MLRAYGRQNWWPAKTPLEMIVGAILTQNTAWTNVLPAIANLRRARMLNWKNLREVETADLCELIRPAGTFNVKAKRLKAFIAFLFERYGGWLGNMQATSTDDLRRELLGVHGIGPETADCILLYALGRPTFVVDAYTKRVLVRHGLIRADAKYAEIKAAFETALRRDAALFNEYHALLVEVGKRHCRSKPRCDGCPLAFHPRVDAK